MNHKLDTDQQVFFYEQEFYVLSNFSAFPIDFRGAWYATSEHAYHAQKFTGMRHLQAIFQDLKLSAHQAFEMAQSLKSFRVPHWDQIKEGIMTQILRAKVQQHGYVKKKLLMTGDRELIEDSWRDDYWGWGADKNGQNRLGKLWMQVRGETRAHMAMMHSREQEADRFPLLYGSIGAQAFSGDTGCANSGP